VEREKQSVRNAQDEEGRYHPHSPEERDSGRGTQSVGGRDWAYELKWDGFRAIVSTEDGLRVRSRRGWNMTPVLQSRPLGPDWVVPV
jgi:ATP-dependent DNA ligase